MLGTQSSYVRGGDVNTKSDSGEEAASLGRMGVLAIVYSRMNHMHLS
jgi:hypothetical protein